MEGLVKAFWGYEMRAINLTFLVLAFLGGLTTSVSSQTFSWFDKVSTIQIGKTTRAEVEQMFEVRTIRHRNEFSRSFTMLYESTGGVLDVEYTTTTCNELEEGYRLPLSTLISFSFWPSKALRRDAMALDLSAFKVSKEDDTENFYYFDELSGTGYNLFQNKELTSVTKAMTTEQNRRFACNKSMSLVELCSPLSRMRS